MVLIRGFDEKALYRIAKESGNEQLKRDVKYMRLIFRSGKKCVAERFEDKAFWMGYHNKDHLRLVGIGVRKDLQRNGFGRFMLQRVKLYSKGAGYKKVLTRTFDGVDFYMKWGGARITGMKDDDFLMEMDI